MIMNEMTRESLDALKERVYRQIGMEVKSCVFIALVSPPGIEITKPGAKFETLTLHDIPRDIDSVLHDLLLVDHIVSFTRGRETMRRGGGPIPDTGDAS